MPVEERVAYIAMNAPGQRDQILTGLRSQPFAPQLRFAPFAAFEECAGQKPREIVITVFVLAQQNQLEGPSGIVLINDSHVCADNRFDACSNCFAVELDHTEQVVLVGQCDGRHAQLGAAIHERGDAHCAVDKRILGVQMQMDEGAIAHPANLTGAKLRRC